MEEFKAKVMAEIDERIRANSGFTQAQMQSLKEQVERIPLPEAPKRAKAAPASKVFDSE